jgi:hypothetical protein
MGTLGRQTTLFGTYIIRYGTIFHTPQPYNLMADLEIWRFIRTFAPVTSMWQIFWFGLLVVRLTAHILLMGCFSKSMLLKKWGCEKRETYNLLIYNDLYKLC